MSVESGNGAAAPNLKMEGRCSLATRHFVYDARVALPTHPTTYRRGRACVAALHNNLCQNAGRPTASSSLHACAPPPPAHAIISCAALGHSSTIKLCALWGVALACRAAVERSHVLAEVASVEPLSAPREARGECAGPSHTHTHVHCTHAPQSSPHAYAHPPRLCITGTVGVKRGLAQMLKGGVIMDVSDTLRTC